jgi:hypothetical protein
MNEFWGLQKYFWGKNKLILGGIFHSGYGNKFWA